MAEQNKKGKKIQKKMAIEEKKNTTRRVYLQREVDTARHDSVLALEWVTSTPVDCPRTRQTDATSGQQVMHGGRHTK